eukprot:COSAG06_NODE_21802_length_744_cov_3.986047_1_plen_90_part_10
MPFACALASCSVCAENESFIIVLRFGAKTATTTAPPAKLAPTHAPARPSRALVADWGRCLYVPNTPRPACSVYAMQIAVLAAGSAAECDA